MAATDHIVFVLAATGFTVALFAITTVLPIVVIFTPWSSLPGWFRRAPFLRRVLPLVAVAVVVTGTLRGQWTLDLDVLDTPPVARLSLATVILIPALLYPSLHRRWELSRWWPTPAPSFWRVLAVLAVCVPFGTGPSWSGLLVGLVLSAIGFLTLWGPALDDRAIRPRRRALIYRNSWLSGFARSRNAAALGRLAFVVGMALSLGGLAEYGFAFLYASRQVGQVIDDGIRVREPESPWRRSWVEVLWPAGCLGVLLGGSATALLIGLVLDEKVHWVPRSDPLGTATGVILQTVIGLEVGLAAIAAASLGIGLQLRSTTFGADVARRLLPTWRLAGAFGAILIATCLALSAMAADPTAGNEPSKLASLAVTAGLIAAMYVVTESTLAVFGLMDSNRIVTYIEDLVAANAWPDSFRISGGGQPDSIRILERSLFGAIRENDVELLERIGECWVSTARAQPALAQLSAFRAPHEPSVADVQLSPNEAYFIDGLDRAQAKLVYGMVTSRGLDGTQLRAIASLAQLIYPPFAAGIQLHKYRGFDDEGVPGFRTIEMLIRGAIQIHDRSLISWFLSLWGRRFELGIEWVERITPLNEQNAEWPHMPYPEKALQQLVEYVRADSESRSNAIWIVVRALEKAESRGVLMAGLNALSSIEAERDPSLLYHSHDLVGIAAKQFADPPRLAWLFERSTRELPMPVQQLNRHDVEGMFILWSVILASIEGKPPPGRDYVPDDRPEMIERHVRAIGAFLDLLVNETQEVPTGFGPFTNADAIHLFLELLDRSPSAIRSALLLHASRWGRLSEREHSWFVERLAARGLALTPPANAASLEEPGESDGSSAGI